MPRWTCSHKEETESGADNESCLYGGVDSFSKLSHHYGMVSLAEATAFLQHPVLGLRLRQCEDQLLGPKLSNPHAIFGSPDDMKLRSCLTLFSAAVPD